MSRPQFQVATVIRPYVDKLTLARCDDHEQSSDSEGDGKRVHEHNLSVPIGTRRRTDTPAAKRNRVATTTAINVG